MPLLHAHCPGSQFLELSNKPNLHDIDLAALRNLEAIVNGLTYQINALRLRIDAIRTGIRTERRRRITEFAHIFESYVPIEVFMAAARNEATARATMLGQIAELRADNGRLREQLAPAYDPSRTTTRTSSCSSTTS